jgi:hypothetical protein
MNEPRGVAGVRAYEPPAVVYEAALEVRAGTPLGLPQPWSGPDPSQPQ